jgi:hypothetical protein
MDAEINNVIYMELYSGPKMAHSKYEKTNVARSIDRDSTVLVYSFTVNTTISFRLNYFPQTNHARKSMWQMLCQERDLQAIKAEKR